MEFYEPITLAISIAWKLEKLLLERWKPPSGEDVREILKELGLEEVCTGRGTAVFRGSDVLAVVSLSGDAVVTYILPAGGGLGEGVEVVAYLDDKLNAFVVEIIPANDLEYEGNIGLEPVIVDAGSFELESSPVLGYFEEEGDGVSLVIDGETYELWKESEKLNVCPICGGELVWEGKKARCTDCGYGVRVVRK